MFCIVRFTDKTTEKAYAVIPRSWYNGTIVRWHHSKEFQANQTKPMDNWKKYTAELASFALYEELEKAEAALDGILLLSTTDSENEKDPLANVSKKQCIQNRKNNLNSSDSEEIDDPGNLEYANIRTNKY